MHQVRARRRFGNKKKSHDMSYDYHMTLHEQRQRLDRKYCYIQQEHIKWWGHRAQQTQAPSRHKEVSQSNATYPNVTNVKGSISNVTNVKRWHIKCNNCKRWHIKCHKEQTPNIECYPPKATKFMCTNIPLALG